MDRYAKDARWPIQELIKWATDDFTGRGIDTPRLDAELLLAHALGCRRVDLYLRFDQCPDEPALAAFRALVVRRRGREPVAQILGSKGFHDIEVRVGPGMYAPRPETELLVDESLTRLRKLGRDDVTVLDLCTGTGAIALALAHALPALRAWAVDLDERSVAAAADNACRLNLADRVSVLPGDLFAPVADLPPFDLITCNPPYVPAAEIPNLMPEVRDHEPRLALDGGPDGLDLVRHLLAEAPSHLRPGGWLLIEIGEGQAPTAARLAPPSLVHEATRLDLARIPRIVIYRKA
jgi:release factor glutamine methyltransferase